MSGPGSSREAPMGWSTAAAQGGVTAATGTGITVTVEDPALETPPPYTEDFNVVVIQECTAVLYTEDGTPYADWDAVLDSGRDSYGWEGGEADE